MNSTVENYIKKYKADGIFISNIYNVRYISGFTGSNAQLLITKSDKFFFTDGRYIVQAKEEVKPGFKQIIYRLRGEKQKKIFDAIRAQRVRKLLFEADSMTVSEFNGLKSAAPKLVWIPIKESSTNIRIYKSDEEIKNIRKAADIAAKSLKIILSKLKPGMTEKNISNELEIALKKNGADKSSFDIIVASGARGALPHASPTGKKIKTGDLLTIDYGAKYNGYHSDETVTVCVGKPTGKQKKIYSVVKGAHDLAIKSIKPGVTSAAIDKIARDYISKAGFGDNFSHSTGHGIGLEVHEEPGISNGSETTLQAGMILTIEPGIYIAGWGGVRIEDMILVTKTGYQVLTKADKSFRSVG